MDILTKGSLDEILESIDEQRGVPFSVKDAKGNYLYANEAWSEVAEAPLHKIVGYHDDRLPWGRTSREWIIFMDSTTRRRGTFHNIDRRPHFREQSWLRSTTEKIYIPSHNILVSRVETSATEDFCRLANKVTEKGIVHGDKSLSIKQIYILHQLIFHSPHKQTARELGCSPNRINQYLREIRELFEADDTKELICALSAHGFFPLLEHFDLLFRHQWLAAEMKRS